MTEVALAGALESGARIVLEDDYPEALIQAQSLVPPALFVQGDESCLFAPTVGIVGTRAATPYGRACAQKFAEALAKAGVTVVSGGALGIDAAAHEGALKAGGRTVAVLAGGIDTVYPAVHAGLFERVVESGCLVSQFAAGSRPLDYKFLARNVLVASLSQAVIVIQAPTRSGALSTAHWAAELGREVFVVPANIDRLEFWGSFNLIRDGATLVFHPDQVLGSLGLKRSPEPPAPKASDAGQKILDALSADPLDAERLVESTGLSASELLAELTMLELDGLVLRESGGFIRKP